MHSINEEIDDFLKLRSLPSALSQEQRSELLNIKAAAAIGGETEEMRLKFGNIVNDVRSKTKDMNVRNREITEKFEEGESIFVNGMAATVVSTGFITGDRSCKYGAVFYKGSDGNSSHKAAGAVTKVSELNPIEMSAYIESRDKGVLRQALKTYYEENPKFLHEVLLEARANSELVQNHLDVLTTKLKELFVGHQDDWVRKLDEKSLLIFGYKNNQKRMAKLLSDFSYSNMDVPFSSAIKEATEKFMCILLDDAYELIFTEERNKQSEED